MWKFASSRRQEKAQDHRSADDERMIRLYGLALKVRRKQDGANAVLTDAVEFDPASPCACIERGNRQLDAGSVERAVADYSRAIELDPQSAIAYNNRGVARAVDGGPREAIQDYDHAIAIDPDNACAYVNRGDAYRACGDCERAVADYTKAVSIDPTRVEAYYGRAVAYQSRSDFALALADYDRAIELDPGSADSRIGRGRIHSRRGHFLPAIADFTQAIESDPDLAAAYNERAHAHLGAKNFSSAAADYARAMALDPNIAQELRAAELSLELRPNQPARVPVPKPGAHDGVTISFCDYLLKPTGFYFWLVPFDPAACTTRPSALQTALKAAFEAYRKQQPQAMVDALKDADADPLVDVFRGIASIAKSNGSPDCAKLEADAERHLRAAANAGDNKARAILAALLSSKKLGMIQDVPQARELAEQAARSNDAFALRQLAVLLFSGALGPADHERAADLMWSAAELGDPLANGILAGFFQTGTGLQQDNVKAERYLSRAADLGLTDAQLLLGDLFFRRYFKKTLQTPEAGIRIFERAMNDGSSAWAAHRLVGLYGCDGRDPPWRNFKKALDLMPKCAPYSHPGIHFTLGAVYRANCDFVSSWAHYNVARDLGSTDAVERLAGLESLLTKKEAQRALDQSQTIKADLKPLPPSILLQRPIR